MSSLFRITIEGTTEAKLPDTIEEWDASKWPDALDRLHDAVELLAYGWRFPAKVKVTID